MGDGFKPEREISADPANYWRMGPGSGPSRTRWERIEPPEIQTDFESGLFGNRYYATVCTARVPGTGGGKIGVRIGPYRSHASAYQAAKQYLQDKEKGNVNDPWP